MPSSIAPQLATLVSTPPTGTGWAFEIKFDGYRILAKCGGGRAQLFTRNANDWTSKMQSLASEVAALPVDTAWLDGEIVVLDERGLPNFNALQNAFDGKRTEHIDYFVFDVLYLNGRDLRRLPFSARRPLLEELFAGHDAGHVRLSKVFEADGQSVFESARKLGLEGIIAKHRDAPYSSLRTKTWLKIKHQLRQEFVIGGFTTRTNGPREIGSLLLGVYDHAGKLHSAGSVGTGWDSKTAAAILRELEKIEIPKPPFDPEHAPTKGRWSRRAAGGERWVKPTAVAEVSFAEWTPDGSVRHATFEGLRRDKPASAIRRENALAGRKAPAVRGS